MKTTTIRLYSLDYSNVKTYFAAALFILGNLVLPQLCHLIPQGGLTCCRFISLRLLLLYKYGWKCWIADSRLFTGFEPSAFRYASLQEYCSAILLKSILLAVVAGYAANRFKRIFYSCFSVGSTGLSVYRDAG